MFTSAVVWVHRAQKCLTHTEFSLNTRLQQNLPFYGRRRRK